MKSPFVNEPHPVREGCSRLPLPPNLARRITPKSTPPFAACFAYEDFLNLNLKTLQIFLAVNPFPHESLIRKMYRQLFYNFKHLTGVKEVSKTDTSFNTNGIQGRHLETQGCFIKNHSFKLGYNLAIQMSKIYMESFHLSNKGPPDASWGEASL